MSISTLVRTDLSALEEANLVTVCRATPSVTVGDRVIFTPNDAQHAAMNTLLSAYISDIRRAARTARVIDRDDAEMVATEKFISLVRDPSRRNERLAGFVSRAMVNAVMNADAEASAVRIPPDTLRRYFNLVADSGSVDAAYMACRDSSNGFDTMTLLAVNRSLNACSVEALLEATAGEGIRPMDLELSIFETSPVSVEETVANDDLVRWLFTLVSPDVAQVLRLSYGFTDVATQALRVAHGFSQDEPLSDAQVSPIVGHSRAKVQRTRVEALRTMASAIETSITNA